MDHRSTLKGKRIGLHGPGWRSGTTAVVSPETQTPYDNAINLITEAGATVVLDPFASSGFATLPATTCANFLGA